jgi:hypothetical protein
MSDVSINLGDTLPWVSEKFLGLIGKDYETVELKEWFSDLQKTAIIEASSVQCMGMRHPLPLSEIYQPTRLIVPGTMIDRVSSEFTFHDKMAASIAASDAIDDKVIAVDAFRRLGKSAIIFAGPGWGKTTFLKHVFMESVRSKGDELPTLFTLRRPTAVNDLIRFVSVVQRIQKREKRHKALLLIDGYDELSIQDRKRVSEAVLKFSATDVGPAYITCRDYYQVYELPSLQVRLDAFSLEDQYSYVTAFLKMYGSKLDSTKVVNELRARRFDDFLAHPLLLALACIVQTSAATITSRSVIKLIAHAIDVLTFRWDESKGVTREALLDGRDRMKLLRKLAFSFDSPRAPDKRVLPIAQRQLDLLRYDKLDATQVLLETAQFFGILVPSTDGWEFVHRTLHDFLAAQYWVETGEFYRTSKYKWNARTAYAACLIEDATKIMVQALANPEDGIETFVEILSNEPDFKHPVVAEAIVEYYVRNEVAHYYHDDSTTKASAELTQPFIRLASSKFLEYLLNTCLEKGTNRTARTIAGYCLYELYTRGLRLSGGTYKRAVEKLGSPEYAFNLLGVGYVRVKFLEPAAAGNDDRIII